MPVSKLVLPVTESWMAFSRWLTAGWLEKNLRKTQTAADYPVIPGSRLYIAASCLPYHVSGYTTRTQAILQALQDTGRQVHAMTRPGYPADRVDRLAEAGQNNTSNQSVLYQHVVRPANNRPVLFYARQAAPEVARLAREHRVEAIHAASNHVNALPGLLAARQLGIPFQYEMRGLWELTRISRQPSFNNSQAFKQGLQLEALVARNADRLFVISAQLGRYVTENWGVDPKRIALLPNCIDPQQFPDPDDEQQITHDIGYAGSLIGYEGLDTLLDAVALLRQQGIVLTVQIAGEGEARAQLQQQAERLDLNGQVRFLGRLPPEQARQVIQQSLLVCIPRKPYQVCEIVPPIKLVEAMAMGKAVIVPDLPVFRDEIGGADAGWFFQAGNAQDLARVLHEALNNREKIADLGRKARKYALEQRSWTGFMQPVVQAYRE